MSNARKSVCGLEGFAALAARDLSLSLLVSPIDCFPTSDAPEATPPARSDIGLQVVKVDDRFAMAASDEAVSLIGHVKVLGIMGVVEFCSRNIVLNIDAVGVPVEPRCELPTFLVRVPKDLRLPFVELTYGSSLTDLLTEETLTSVSEIIYTKHIRWRSPTMSNLNRKCWGDLVVEVSHPKLAEIINDCRDCVNYGEAASLIAGIAAAVADTGPTGIGAAAVEAFKAAFWACLRVKGIKWAAEVGVDVRIDNQDCD
jgi:hypothetical protein